MVDIDRMVDFRVRVDAVSAVPAAHAPEGPFDVPHPPSVMLGATRWTGEVDAVVPLASSQVDTARSSIEHLSFPFRWPSRARAHFP